MKFSCEKAVLMSAINIVSRACAPKSPSPLLEGILVEAGEFSVQLTGYDLKRGIYTSFDADISTPGSLVLGARIFGDIIRNLPDGIVNITSSGCNVTITCGNSEYSVIGYEADDYPELPSIDSQNGIEIPQNLLGDMIRRTIFAVSDNEARPVYTGELFEIKDGELKIIAVDGYRLAMRTENVANIGDDCSFIVPAKSLSDLEKLCSEEDEKVRIRLDSKHITFVIGRTVLVSRRLDGEFLNYRKVVPTDFAIKVEAERNKLIRSVERVSLVIDDRLKNPVRCTFGENYIKMLCSTALGKADDMCIVVGDGKNTEIGFNNRYLLDALKAAPSENVNICINSGSSPCVIAPANEDDKSYTYMILPVRLKAGE